MVGDIISRLMQRKLNPNSRRKITWCLLTGSFWAGGRLQMQFLPCDQFYLVLLLNAFAKCLARRDLLMLQERHH